MASLQVDVKPAVLVWARESIGLSRDKAASRLQMTTTALRFLEEGVGDVSMPKLRRMAEVYDRPLIAFFLPEPPTHDESLPDFRQRPDIRGATWTPAMHKAYRRVAGQREVALDLAELDEERPPAIPLRLDLNDDPEAAGDLVRGWLNVPESETVVGTPYETFNTWVGLVEEQAVFVTQVTGVDLGEMRGFSIGEQPFPFIALNSGDAIRGKSFTLLHELTHVLLRRSALCDLDGENAPTDLGAGRMEWFCNQVAASVLMPRRALLREEMVVRASRGTRWRDDELFSLAGRFGVSAEAMLLRLVTLDRASWDLYRERRPHFLQSYREQQDQGKGRITYYPKTIRNLGRRYIATVLNAYGRDEITDADLIRYLDVKLKNIPTLVEKIGIDR